MRKTKSVSERIIRNKKTEEKVEKKPKNNVLKKFLTAICEPKVIGTFLIGLIAGLVIMRMCFPERIAKLADGKEVVLSYGDTKLTADDLYEDMKMFFSVNVLLNDVDLGILDEKYGKTEERTEYADYYTKYYIDMYKEYYGYSEEEAIKQLGFSDKDELYKYFELDFLRNKYYDEYLEGQLSEKDIKDFYDKEIYGGFDSKHILVKLDENATSKDKKAAKKLAETIISRLKKGEEWNALVEEYGDEIIAEELGVKTFKDSLDKAYVDAALKLKTGTYSSKPVLSSFGYHIIYKVSQEEKKPLDEIREDVFEKIKTNMESEDPKLFYKVLVSMREEANLKIFDTKLNDEYKLLVASYK